MADRNGQVREVQATAENVTLTGKVDFAGETFRLADKIGIMPMLKFAHAASSGVQTDDLEGMAAMYAMIRDCIHPGDWQRFERSAIESHADGDDLIVVVQEAMEQAMARPTGAPSGSSPPGRRTSPKSRGRSSSLPEAFASLPEGELVPVSEILR